MYLSAMLVNITCRVWLWGDRNAAGVGHGIKQLVKRLATLKPQLIVLEASGGYEFLVTAALAEAQLPVALVNPQAVRKFAGAAGKSDAFSFFYGKRNKALLPPRTALIARALIFSGGGLCGPEGYLRGSAGLAGGTRPPGHLPATRRLPGALLHQGTSQRRSGLSAREKTLPDDFSWYGVQDTRTLP